MGTKTSLIYVLLHSFQYFQYYPEKEVKLYTIVNYPEIGKDYFEFLKEYETKPLPEIKTAKLTDELKKELQQMCTVLAQSMVYELVLPSQATSKLPLLRSSPNPPISFSTNSVLNPLRLGDDEKSVPMYPCYMGDYSNDHFFLAYGFNEGYVFVLKDFDDGDSKVLKVYGLVEPTPDLDQTYYMQRHLEKYFHQIHRTYQAKSRNFDRICSLNGYQQFRLCSVLHNARNAADLGKLPGSAENPIITWNRHQKRCEENLKVTFPALAEKNPAYSNSEVRITAMPCHTPENKFSFLVSQNPADEHSVFILDKRINYETREKVGRVLHHVSDIALLKYVNDLY